MKPRSKFMLSLLLAVSFSGVNGLAGANDVCFNDFLPTVQQGPGRGPIAVARDPEVEKQSYKSLDAAKFYFYKRKPDKGDTDGLARLNKAVESRLQEIVDTNPSFARIAEVYFMLGEVYKRMGENEKAVQHWTKAVQETSDEKLKADAQKRLDEAKTQSKEKKE